MTWEDLWYGPQTASTRLAGLALAPVAGLYGLGRALASGLAPAPTRIDGLFIVSVGNVVVGGAGKTPVVIFLANWAKACGHSVAVLSRGYGRTSTAELECRIDLASTECGDEPRLIARRCPGVRVWVGADRVSLARRARAAGATFAILDDGFQHRRLARDVDLVVRGGEGNGHLLPWGPLRESAEPKRPHLTWLRDGADGPSEAVRANHEITSIEAPTGQSYPASSLAGVEVCALLGVARPRRVISSLERLGAQVKAVHAYPDHHAFSATELARAQATSLRVVTTEKDRERLPVGHNAWALTMDVKLTQNLSTLARALGLDPARAPSR